MFRGVAHLFNTQLQFAINLKQKKLFGNSSTSAEKTKKNVTGI
jgi:hypothetical protein